MARPLRSIVGWPFVGCLLFVSLGVAALPAPAGAVAQRTASTSTGGASANPMASPGCGTHGTRTAGLDAARQTLRVGGTTRWYLLTTPEPGGASARPRPLVLDFHGLAEGATLQAQTSQFPALGQRDDFYVVEPNGTGKIVKWDTDAGSRENPDLTFVGALLDQIEQRYCIDQSRIYATGLSDGAFMTSLLACRMADRIAAFAPVSGVQLPRPCRPGRKVPIVAFHGTADPILYFNGGIGTALLNHVLGGGPPPSTTTTVPAKLNGRGYPATVAAWAAKDGCADHPSNVRVSPHVIRRTYRCPPDAAVVFYVILGGGHAWPGSQASEAIASITGPTTFEINGTQVIWQFFSRFQLRR